MYKSYIQFFLAQFMASKGKKSKQRQQWDPSAMQRALEAVREHKVPINTAATEYHVPRNTLKRRLLNKNKTMTSHHQVSQMYH